MLAGLYPGRIDLGLGRAAGTDPMTTHALQRDRSRAMPDDFPEQLAELLAYFDGTIPISNPLARLAKILPGRPETPEPWLLGSSPQSAVWAGELGLPYAFADFINSSGAEIAALYRRGVPGRPAPGRAAHDRRGLGRGGRDRGGGPSGSPRAAGWRSRCCAAAA